MTSFINRIIFKKYLFIDLEFKSINTIIFHKLLLNNQLNAKKQKTITNHLTDNKLLNIVYIKDTEIIKNSLNKEINNSTSHFKLIALSID